MATSWAFRTGAWARIRQSFLLFYFTNNLLLSLLLLECLSLLFCCYLLYFRWTPYPVIVTLLDNKDYIRVLL